MDETVCRLIYELKGMVTSTLEAAEHSDEVLRPCLDLAENKLIEILERIPNK
ncbi:hypothetical protein MUN88_14245 [Gracilibacillus caseinilyticus]|uniref:Spo0E like sporulation regulatory protein n=1 Tax=Gracilibacillus caseinilyticus TaxID=2932256 RepID=A0ABY4ES15_9BACI|nr:hypothetical protein [Gracilibacillus caseinilyticus]UOQ47227.1 hypothetical protein MUN88_14245 [Gracilibacillus caseinilyticus]